MTPISLAASPRPVGSGFLSYGTAGFRTTADRLCHVSFRMGMLMSLRALYLDKAVGIMVTASHNPVADNGLKAVDSDGGMLDREWETYAEDLVNCKHELLESRISGIAKTLGVNYSKNRFYGGSDARVFIGRDTRPHSVKLAMLAMQGVISMSDVALEDIGLVTTPQLHHCVRAFNLPSERNLASEQGYYKKIAQAYSELLGDRKPRSPFIVDAALGVGGVKFSELLRVVHAEIPDLVHCLQIRNSPTGTGFPLSLDEEGRGLNNGIGAEHVQKSLLLPLRDTVHLPSEAGIRFASFDGDADRLIYFRASSEKSLNLFDGDRIACLFVSFIKKQLDKLPVEISKSISLACIQTAYANGAAQRYVRNTLNLDAPITKTGVKYLHEKALEYDIAVYFEANGHGTVLFKSAILEKIQEAMTDLTQSSLNEEGIKAAKNILALAQLLNQATGDAMADCLAVEAILCIEDMTLDDWDSFYSDLPSRQLKCTVKDRSIIKTSEDETQVLEPEELQESIDRAVAEFQYGRAFARPSGTEDAVRVYAEASTQKQAECLATKVAQAVFDFAKGVGDRPC